MLSSQSHFLLTQNSKSLPITSNSYSTNLQSPSFRVGIDDMDSFFQVGNKVADATGEVIRSFFRKLLKLLIKKISVSPVTIADRTAEEAMVKIILENFPSHAIYGEENVWRYKDKTAEFVWVLDPVDGIKSFIKERWIGIKGRKTTMNGQEVSTRACPKLSQAYLYTTSPHLFSGDAEEAFARVRNKVKVPLYDCDCYAYALLASEFVDVVIESGLKVNNMSFLYLLIEGDGGVVTDWKGEQHFWEASSDSLAPSFNVLAAGDKQLHRHALMIFSGSKDANANSSADQRLLRGPRNFIFLVFSNVYELKVNWN
ncbi:hypothetical protein MKW94_002599 [Papaver nudicaule]|uniref:Uncharacterized protein n=1 Tax=Papaver nudicaule TaxID=74823 RepID=A0AA41VL20_PAPNU|nr:hypothetical protein [Papaver nudicaule]